MTTYQSALKQAEKIVGELYIARYTDMPTEKNNIAYFLKGEGLISKDLSLARDVRNQAICYEFCMLISA